MVFPYFIESNALLSGIGLLLSTASLLFYVFNLTQNQAVLIESPPHSSDASSPAVQ